MLRHLKNNKNNRLISLHIDDDELQEIYKTIWTRTEDLKSTELDNLPVYDSRYIKTKVKTNGDKIYTNFRSLNVIHFY